MFFDIKKEVLRYLFCIGETRTMSGEFLFQQFLLQRSIEKEIKGSSVEEEAEETQS